MRLEYAMTDVSRVLYPNRLLRDAGLLSIDEKDGMEHLNAAASRALAVVDHQFAHVYVKDAADVARVAAIFEGVAGIAEGLSGDERANRRVDHPRSGEIGEPDGRRSVSKSNSTERTAPRSSPTTIRGF